MLKPLYFLIGTPLLVLGADWGLKAVVKATPNWSGEAQMATMAIAAVLFFAALTAIAEPPRLLAKKKTDRSKR